MKVAEGLTAIKGADGLFYVNDGTGVYVADIKTVKVDHYETNEDGEQILTTIKEHHVGGPLTDSRGGKWLSVNVKLGREDRRKMKHERNLHLTKKLRKVRGKVLYGDKNISKFYSKRIPVPMCAKLTK